MKIVQSLNPFKSSALGKVPSFSPDSPAFPSVIQRSNFTPGASGFMKYTANTDPAFFMADDDTVDQLPSQIIAAMNIILGTPATYTRSYLTRFVDRAAQVSTYGELIAGINPVAMRLAAWTALSFPSVFGFATAAHKLDLTVTAAALLGRVATGTNSLRALQNNLSIQNKMVETEKLAKTAAAQGMNGKSQLDILACAIRFYEIEAEALRNYEKFGVIDAEEAARLQAYMDADGAWRSWAGSFPPNSTTSILPNLPTNPLYTNREAAIQAATAHDQKTRALMSDNETLTAALAAWRAFFTNTTVAQLRAGALPSFPARYDAAADNQAIGVFKAKIDSLIVPVENLLNQFKNYVKSPLPDAQLANSIYDKIIQDGRELEEINSFMSLAFSQQVAYNNANRYPILQKIQNALKSWAVLESSVSQYLNLDLAGQEQGADVSNAIINGAIRNHVNNLRDLRQQLALAQGAVTAMGQYIGQSLQAQASGSVQFPQGYTASAEVSSAIASHKGNLASLFKQLEDQTNTAAMYLNFLEKAAQGYASLDEILQAQQYPPQLADILRTISANMKPRVQDAVQCIDKLAPVIAYLENVDGHLSPQQDADIMRAQAVLRRLYDKIKMWEDVDRAWRDWLNSGADNILNQKPTFPDGYSRSESDTAAGKMQQEIGGALDELSDALKTAQAQPPPQNGAEQQQQIIDCSAAIKRAEQLVEFIQATEANQRAAVAAGYAAYNSAGALQADLEKAWAVLSALYAKRDELQNQLPCPTCTPGGATTSTAAVTDSSDNKGAIALGLAALAGLAYWYSKKQAR